MTPSHTNELIHESSPYLLQHAHNPVNWLPWSARSLALAKTQNKPILISIGYSACHWCHVMERESFEDESVAQLMNNSFINIKIDREERPDLDQIYMDAVQLMTGTGGWPLHVFLTPDTEPFFGGTYFPPQRMYQRMSWTEVLLAVNELWQHRRDEVVQQAQKLLQHMRSSAGILSKQILIAPVVENFSDEKIRTIAAKLMSAADTKHGGLGKAPKFPQTFCLQFLLMYGYFKKDETVLQHALHSIRSMIIGGLYDQLGGGFARYSTDDEWLVPHFEKMLYDNALLIGLMSEAYMITRDSLFKSAIEQTISFCERELKAVEGGYYSALDADSEGEEGKYYVWEREHWQQTLGPLAAVCEDFFGVTENGNWEGKNILTNQQSLMQLAEKYGCSVVEINSMIDEGRLKLLHARTKRTRPATDHKIIAAWNALYLSALCKASMALKSNPYINLAVALHEDMMQRFFIQDQLVFHVSTNHVSAHHACLDDLACLIQSEIQLHELTGDIQYLHHAKTLTEQAISEYGDENEMFFYYTSKSQHDILLRKPDIHDGAVPSGNGLMAENLFHLSVLFDRSDWRERATGMWRAMDKLILKHPSAFGNWSVSILKQNLGLKELILTGQQAQSWLPELLNRYFPQKIILTAINPLNLPVLEGKSYSKPVSAYICENYQCQKIVHSLDEMLKLMGELSTY